MAKKPKDRHGDSTQDIEEMDGSTSAEREARKHGMTTAQIGRMKIGAAKQRYQRIKKLGMGGIGTVYLARQEVLGRNVALKEIRELFQFFTPGQKKKIVKCFEEQVGKAAKLSHPNIAVILDASAISEYPFVVTEYLPSGNLRRLLTNAESIPPEFAFKIFLQCLHALKHAHELGVIHRGVKPENILFDRTGNVRLTDFALEKMTERDQDMIRHVYVGTGSVGYMAPELFSNPTAAGPGTDLYALGIVFYEMLARRLPGRRSPMPCEIHPVLPGVVDDLFDRLTQDDPAQRFSSAAEALETFHRDDQAGAFLDPPTAMLFLESPITTVDVDELEEHGEVDLDHQEEDIEVVEEEDESLSDSDGGKEEFATNRSEDATTDVRPPKVDPDLASGSIDTSETDTSEGGDVSEPTTSKKVTEANLQALELAEDADGEVDPNAEDAVEQVRSKHKERVSVPYSFHQRSKGKK